MCDLQTESTHASSSPGRQLSNSESWNERKSSFTHYKHKQILYNQVAGLNHSDMISMYHQTCLKFGTGRSCSNLERKKPTRTCSALSKSGPYSTGNTSWNTKTISPEVFMQTYLKNSHYFFATSTAVHSTFAAGWTSITLNVFSMFTSLWN